MCELQEKPKEFYVEVVTFGTDVVVSRMGPMNSRRAERVEDGANINLDHDNFYTRVIEE